MTLDTGQSIVVAPPREETPTASTTEREVTTMSIYDWITAALLAFTILLAVLAVVGAVHATRARRRADRAIARLAKATTELQAAQDSFAATVRARQGRHPFTLGDR